VEEGYAGDAASDHQHVSALGQPAGLANPENPPNGIEFPPAFGEWVLTARHRWTAGGAARRPQPPPPAPASRPGWVSLAGSMIRSISSSLKPLSRASSRIVRPLRSASLAILAVSS